MNRQIDSSSSWDEEYDGKGIPSSWKEAPSSVVLWGLANLAWMQVELTNRSLVIDVGCGTGRNSLALAERTGSSVMGFDYSGAAVDLAKRRLSALDLDASVKFLHRDMREPIPAEDSSVTLAMDIFVYFHLLSDQERTEYRRELHRVLGSGGVLLMSLATARDGYYSLCPAEPRADGVVPVVVDPHAGVGNIMHTLYTLEQEMSDLFRLEMSWEKVASGPMHGDVYVRHTLATLWRTRQTT